MDPASESCLGPSEDGSTQLTGMSSRSAAAAAAASGATSSMVANLTNTGWPFDAVCYSVMRYIAGHGHIFAQIGTYIPLAGILDEIYVFNLGKLAMIKVTNLAEPSVHVPAPTIRFPLNYMHARVTFYVAYLAYLF